MVYLSGMMSMGTTARDQYTPEKIEELREALRDQPAKEVITTRKVIESLRDEIHSLRSRGWSYGEISKLLAENGLEVSASTVRTYVGTTKPRKRRQKAAKSKIVAAFDGKLEQQSATPSAD